MPLDKINCNNTMAHRTRMSQLCDTILLSPTYCCCGEGLKASHQYTCHLYKANEKRKNKICLSQILFCFVLFWYWVSLAAEPGLLPVIKGNYWSVTAKWQKNRKTISSFRSRGFIFLLLVFFLISFIVSHQSDG